MIIDTAVSLIFAWCSYDSADFTKESKWSCTEVLVNCVLENGKIIQNEDKLKWCLDKGQHLLIRYNK